MATSVTAGSAVNPQAQVVNLGNLYVNGMALTYLTSTTLSVGAGQCRDSTDKVDIIMGGNQYSSTSNPGGEQGVNNPITSSAAVTIDAAINGAGGLDVGDLANSTRYYVYAIADSRGFNSGSAMLSASTSPSMPLGYDCWRRVGQVATDGSAAIRAFFQTGAGLLRTMRYQVPVAPGSAATSGSATYASIGTLGALTPLAQVDVILGVSMDSNTAGNILYLAPYGNTALASSGFEAKLSSSVTTAPQHGVLVCPQASNSGTYQVLYATTEASDAVTFLVIGYVDQL